MVLHFPVAIQDSIAPKTDIRMTIGKIVQHVIDIIIFHDLLVGFTRKRNANLSTNLETMNFGIKTLPSMQAETPTKPPVTLLRIVPRKQ